VAEATTSGSDSRKREDTVVAALHSQSLRVFNIEPKTDRMTVERSWRDRKTLNRGLKSTDSHREVPRSRVEVDDAGGEVLRARVEVEPLRPRRSPTSR